MSAQGLQGTMKSLRIGRRIGGRRTLLCLISGAAISLLVLALTPHPVPNTRSHALGHRRIQQEDDDYTAPKHAGVLAGSREPSSNSNHIQEPSSSNIKSPVLELGKKPGGFSLRPFLPKPVPSGGKNDKKEDTGVGHVEEVLQKKTGQPTDNVSPPNLTRDDALTQIIDIPRSAQSKNELVAKAQETALTALQHGFKLTEGQKKLIERMTPRERKQLEDRVTKVRAMQERAYLTQLRAKKQVQPRKGGGEEVISTPRMPIRFPATLKKMHPRDWLPQYKLFLNLTHYPWPKSHFCNNFSITFEQPDVLPTRGLVSFPSSGNTWIRYLVEAATGMFTGSFYDDTSLTKKGMYGEGIVYDSGMTILQKSHGYTTGDAMKLTHPERLSNNHMAELGYQGVIVVRNPFKALISHRHLDTGGHTGYAPKTHFLGKGWAEFVTLKIMLWKEFYMDWLSVSDPQNIHITYYEHVKENTVGEMQKILTYLKMPIDESRLQCVGQNSDGLFKRRPSKNVPLEFNPFTRELKDLVYEAVDELNEVLESKGKDGLPLNLYQLYDSHEAEVSRYLRRQKSGVS